MARGKQTCRILKEIRQRIADANDIDFVTSECRYKGDCLGTCPKCEAEVRYLEQQLRARSLAGKAIALAGISAGMFLMSGCGGTSTKQASETVQGDLEVPVEQVEVTDTVDTIDTIEEGELPELEDTVATKKREVAEPVRLVVGEVSDDPESRVQTTPPLYPGGFEKEYQWISQHIQYPQDALDSNIEGRVVVLITVKEDGSIVDPKVISSISPSLDEEALRVVSTIPRFDPGTRDGKAVEDKTVVVVSFKIKDKVAKETDLQDAEQDTTANS